MVSRKAEIAMAWTLLALSVANATAWTAALLYWFESAMVLSIVSGAMLSTIHLLAVALIFGYVIHAETERKASRAD